MNQISVDINILDDSPAKILLRLLEAKQLAQRRLKAWQATVNCFPGLFSKLEEFGLEPSFNLNDGGIDLNIAGSPEMLTKVWRELRRAGFKNDSFPSDRKDGTFSTYWRADDEYARIWMYFASTLCRRIQVGTKMIEQPIYETQCGEMPLEEIEKADSSVIPF